jgi:hypothetical protein
MLMIGCSNYISLFLLVQISMLCPVLKEYAVTYCVGIPQKIYCLGTQNEKADSGAKLLSDAQTAVRIALPFLTPVGGTVSVFPAKVYCGNRHRKPYAKMEEGKSCTCMILID